MNIDEMEFHCHVRRLNMPTPDATPLNILMPLTFRIVAVLDKQANGNIPAYSDVFDTAAQADPTLAVLRVDNNKRFVIVKDVKKVIDPGNPFMNTGTTPDSIWVPGASVDFDMKKKFPSSFPIEFGGTTGAIGEVKSNNLVVFLASSYWDDAEVQGPEIIFNGYIRYTDF